MNRKLTLPFSYFACVALLGVAHGANADCAKDITGKWQLSHVVIQGHTVNDDTQSWEFKSNGTVRFLKTRPVIDATADYSCEGDVIFMKAAIPDRLKILEFDGTTMAWESLEHGGVFHVVRAQ
jgi:hypothetical protein